MPPTGSNPRSGHAYGHVYGYEDDYSITQHQARTANNRVVNFTGQPRLINQMVDIEIKEAFTFSLRGEVVRVEA